MKVAIHARTSHEEALQGQKIESQIATLEKMAEQNGWEIVDRYIEVDWPGGETLERPEMDRLRDDARQHKFEACLDTHPDRISRVLVQQLLVLDEFKKLEIKWIFSTQPGFGEGSEESQLITKTVLALNSELERMRILERTRRGRLYKVSSGNICTSRPPYGFSYVKENKDNKIPGHFIHNPLEIENLKLILEWAKDGKSQRWIIKELHRRKISTRNGKLKWQKSTIGKILNINLEVYAGSWFYLKYQHVEPKNPISQVKYKKYQKSSRKLRDKSEWLKVGLPKELAIISKEDVALIRYNQQKNKVFTEGNQKNFYLLGKMVYCNFCNQPDYSDSFHGKGYYRCADKKRQFPNPAKCQGGSIKAETLESYVWESIKNAMSNPKVLAPQVSKFIELQKDDGVIRDSGLIAIQKQRQQLEKERELTIEAYRQEALTLEELKEQRTMFEIKQNQLDRQEQEIIANRKKAGVMNMEFLNSQIEVICKEFKKELEFLKDEEKRQILQWLSFKVFTGNYQFNLDFKLPIPLDAGRWTLQFTQRSTGSR